MLPWASGLGYCHFGEGRAVPESDFERRLCIATSEERSVEMPDVVLIFGKDT
jgi:hypothetical protein